MRSIREIIRHKRDGAALCASEIEALVTGIANGSVSDAQIGAFTMAVWFRGMSTQEQIALTCAMRDSGRVLEWPDLDGPVVDKHSTGGVGDLVSLVLGPMLAACGAFVPMISGRGLGHTGGTLDKLEAIPGFDTAPDVVTLQRWVRQQGIAIVGQTAELVPADRRIYAVRDVTATVSSPPLIVSSILSKKLAEGLDALVMDIKSGSGAVTVRMEDARRLAGQLVRVAAEAGLACNALITDMDQPLAWSAGNALEVAEAIAYLRGDARHDRLHAVVLSLGSELLQLAGMSATQGEARDALMAVLDSGTAAERFARMVAGQGGAPDLVDSPENILPAAPVVEPVFSLREGRVCEIDTRAVGFVVVALGGGRRRPGDDIDHSVGLSGLCSVGDPAGRERPLAVVHAASRGDWEAAAAALQEAIRIGEEAPSQAAPVMEKIEGVVPNGQLR